MTNKFSKVCNIGANSCFTLKLAKNKLFKLNSLYSLQTCIEKLFDKDSKMAERLDNLMQEDWRQAISDINDKYEEEPDSLTEEEKQFVERFAEAYYNAREDAKAEEKNKGVSIRKSAVMYSFFQYKFPMYGSAIVDAIVECSVKTLDAAVAAGKYGNTWEEVFDNYGVTGFFLKVREQLNEAYNKKYAENNRGNITDVESKMSELKALFSNNRAWESAVFMAKAMLFDATRLKLGNALDYVKEFQGDTTNDLNEHGVPKDNERSEEQGREHWMNKADTISSFKSLTREARSILYRLHSDEEGILSKYALADVMKLHKDISDLFYNKAILNSDDLVKELEHISDRWAINLKNLIKKDITGNIKTTLFTAYYHIRQDYHSTETRNGVTYTNDASLSTSELIRMYKASVYVIDPTNNSCIFNPSGVIDYNKFFLRNANWEKQGMHSSLRNICDQYGRNFNEEWFDDLTEEEKRIYIDKINNWLNLKMDEAQKDQLQENNATLKEFFIEATKLSYAIAKRLSENRYGAMIADLISNSDSKKALGRLLRKVVKVRSSFQGGSPIERSVRYKGSTYMTSVTPNFLGDLMMELRHAALTGGVAGLRKYLQDTYMKDSLFYNKDTDTFNNKWLEQLYNTTEKELADPASFFNRFTTELVRGLGNELKEWQDFIEKDNYLFSALEFFKEMSSYEQGQPVRVPLFVTGDSNSSRYLTVKFDTITDTDFINIAMDEVRRMAEYEELVKLGVSNIKDNLYKFKYLPDLNTDAVLFTLNGKDYDIKDVAKALQAKDAAVESRMLDYLQQEVPKVLKNGLLKFIQDLKKEGLIYEVKPRVYNLSKDFRAALPLDLRDSSIDVDGLIKHWYYNTKFNTVQQLQFLSIDPCFYADTQEAQKRYKEMIASGRKFDTARVIEEEKNGVRTSKQYTHQKVVYFNEIREDMDLLDPDYMRVLEANGVQRSDFYTKREVNGKRRKGNPLTDGQAYRSFASYRRLMLQAGGDKWTKNHEEFYNKIMEIRSKSDPKEKEEKLKELYEFLATTNITLQPLKLYYYGFETVVTESGKEKLIPVQHKYAEIPLIPELIPSDNKVLREMAEFMDENDVDLIAASTCVKIGGYGQCDLNKDDIKGSLKNAKLHVLDLKNLREQNNVPEHNDTARARGTQFIKHGYMGLADFGSKDINDIPFLATLKSLFTTGEAKKLKLADNVFIDLDANISGEDMMKLWNTLGSSGFIRSFNTLAETITDPEALGEMLSAMAEIDANAPKDKLLSYSMVNGEFMVPLSETSVAFDNFASIISRLKKDVIKQRFMGGSLVQVSPLGYENILKVHTNGNNITYVDCARTFDFSYTGFDGVKVELDYFEYVDPSTGRLWKDEAHTELADDEHLEESLLEQRFKGILDMIAYRIPTEKAYSLINLKAKRFFHKSMGGIIMVPAQYTTVAGFDFDIDKLYFIRREYALADIEAESADVWKDYYGLDDAYERIPGKENTEGGKMHKALTAVRDAAIKDAENTLNSKLRNLDDARFESKQASRKLFNMQRNLYQHLKKLPKGYKVKYEKSQEPMEPTARNSEQWQEWNKYIKWKAKYDKLTEELNRVKLAFAKRQILNDLHNEVEDAENELIHLQNKYLYQFWQGALSLLAAQGEDISKFPKSADDAYRQFLGKNFTDRKYCKWKSDYDIHKSILENSQAAVNNLMFDFVQSRLTDIGTVKERYTPGGFFNFQDAKNKMLAIRYGDSSKYSTYAEFEAYAKNFKLGDIYDITELSTIAHYQTWNALYDKLIGMAANQSIHQRLAALYHTFKLKNPIRFGGMLGNQNAGYDLKERFVAMPDGSQLDTELIVTELLAASVDAVKDAVLEFFGIDDKNFSIVCLMAKIGATPEDIGLLLNQPIVVEACRQVKLNGGKMSLSNALEKAYKLLFEADYSEAEIDGLKVGAKFKRNDNGNTARDSYLTKDKLIKGLKGDREVALATIHILKELSNSAQAVSNIIKVSKTTSTNSISSEYGDMKAMFLNAEAIEKECRQKDYPLIIDVKGDGNPVSISSSLLVNDNEKLLGACADSPCGMEQVAFSIVRTTVEKLLSAYFPYSSKGYNYIYRLFTGIIKDGRINGDMVNDIITFLPQYLIGRTKGVASQFQEYCLASDIPYIYRDKDGNDIQTDLSILEGIEDSSKISRPDFYAAIFPVYFENLLIQNKQDIKDGKNVEDYSKIPLIAAITRMAKAYSNNNVELSIPDIGSYKKTEKERIMSSWESMAASDDPVLRNLAYHLFYYSYFQAGLSFSPLSFSAVIPTRIKRYQKGYLEFFKLMFNIEGSNGELQIPGEYTPISTKELITSFILNHYKKYYQLCRDWFSDNESNEINKQLDEHPSYIIADAHEGNLRKLAVVTKTDSQGNPIEYKFIPSLLVFDNKTKKYKIFICASNDIEQFNVSTKTMKYVEYSLPASNKDFSTPMEASIERSIIGKNETWVNIMRTLREQRQLLLALNVENSQDSEEGHFDGSEGTEFDTDPSAAESLFEIQYSLLQLKSFSELTSKVKEAEVALDDVVTNSPGEFEKVRLIIKEIEKIVVNDTKLQSTINKLLTDVKGNLNKLIAKNGLNRRTSIANLTGVAQENALRMEAVIRLMHRFIKMGNNITGPDKVFYNGEWILNYNLSKYEQQVTNSELRGYSVSLLLNVLFPNLKNASNQISSGVAGWSSDLAYAAGDTFDAIAKDYFDGIDDNEYPNINSGLEAGTQEYDNAQKTLNSIRMALGGFLRDLQDLYGEDLIHIITEEFSMGGILRQGSQGNETVAPVTGRPDMIIIAGNDIYIMDFKTGMNHPSGDLMERYCLQLAMYKKILKNMFPNSNIHISTLYAKTIFQSNSKATYSTIDGLILEDSTPILNTTTSKLDFRIRNWKIDDPKIRLMMEAAESKLENLEMLSLPAITQELIEKEIEEIKKELNLC